MVEEQKQQMGLKFVDTKPIFADEVALVLKVKAGKNDKGEVEKEGQIMLVFIDMMKGTALGEFVISKNTAKSLAKMLPETMANLEKQLNDRSMPKPAPEIKTTSDPSYR
jgi:hypothetical protein